MTVMLCMLVDSMMIGRFLGVDSMTAYGLANPVLLIFAAYGAMLSAGIQVMCGKTMGAGDKEGTNACFSASAVLALGVALAGTILVLLLVSPLCTILGAGRAGANNPVFFLTRDYLRGFIVGAPAFIVAQIMVPFLQISGNRVRLALAVVLMTLSDIAFDLLNVFVFRGGMLGMGLASSFSYYLALIVGLAYLYNNGFEIWVISGTERTTTRAIVANSPISEYVRPEHVIGTDFEVKQRGHEDEPSNMDFKYENGDELVLTGGFIQKNLNANKSIYVEREIGQRPVLAFGNSGSDTSMMNYTIDERNPYLAQAYMVVADDNVREWGKQDWDQKSADYIAKGYIGSTPSARSGRRSARRKWMSRSMRRPRTASPSTGTGWRRSRRTSAAPYGTSSPRRWAWIPSPASPGRRRRWRT